MSPGSSTESYPAFARIGLRKTPEKPQPGHVARMGESRNAYRVLVGRPEGKRPFGMPRRRWEDNIKMDLKEVGYDGRDWIDLAQDRDQWRAYVRAVMNLRTKSARSLIMDEENPTCINFEHPSSKRIQRDWTLQKEMVWPVCFRDGAEQLAPKPLNSLNSENWSETNGKQTWSSHMHFFIAPISLPSTHFCVNFKCVPFHFPIHSLDSLNKDKSNYRGYTESVFYPTELKVGVSSFKALKNGNLVIETQNRVETETICKNINEKCGIELEANTKKLRKPRLIIFNVPEELTIEDAREAILHQNDELNLKQEDLVPKFMFQDRSKRKNLIIEVSPQARKIILAKKLKIGWHLCGGDDYIKHKKVATTNLANMVRESNIDLAFIQEPYTINNKVAGIPKTYRTYSNGSERKRAAIIANNKEMDVILINQLSDEDCVVVEIRFQQDKIYAASVYCDITKDIGIDIRKIENIINHAQGVGTIICVDSNSRNTLWHDTVTNRRGEILEDFLLTNNLYVMNENVAAPTFETIRGKSRIDLTICDSLILGYFEDWRCGEEESCCDHNNITFKINIKKSYYCGETENYTGYKFNTKTGDMRKFDDRLKANVVNKFQCKEIENEDIEKELLEKLKNAELVELETIIHDYQSCIVAACNEAFKKCSRGNFRRGRTVPWWTQELTILRKKVNALRRRFQRTMNNEDLRMERKGKYLDGKRIYEMKLHYEKLSSWKKYCTLTEGSNPWNAIYKIAAGKLRSPTSLTALLKPDGTFTADTASTINLMIHHFTPDDDPLTDNQHQREIRELMNEEINTEDDREFTQEEIIRVLKKFDPKKHREKMA
ncbi:hypothetical protein ANN_14308 [Periplaneta americana]|uniref:Endonuclease/exonuclease/phosphatase domain-containing protein n=1 Tax=Periplaneta americana TaxID=6978 RepID=A0ABQ8SX64_PERAM|nr:hypothetical protein ANN_14308 [Periplaneta americana]